MVISWATELHWNNSANRLFSHMPGYGFGSWSGFWFKYEKEKAMGASGEWFLQPAEHNSNGMVSYAFVLKRRLGSCDAILPWILASMRSLAFKKQTVCSSCLDAQLLRNTVPKNMYLYPSVHLCVPQCMLAYFCQKLQLFLANKKWKKKRKETERRTRLGRKFSLEIQAIAFEKFQFLTVCVRVVRQILFILYARQTKNGKQNTAGASGMKLNKTEANRVEFSWVELSWRKKKGKVA